MTDGHLEINEEPIPNPQNKAENPIATDNIGENSQTDIENQFFVSSNSDDDVENHIVEALITKVCEKIEQNEDFL